MAFIDETRERLQAWLESSAGRRARCAIRSTDMDPQAVAATLHAVTEDPQSAADTVASVERARQCAGLASDDVDIERWLLVRQAVDLLAGAAMERLGGSAMRLTCEEMAALVDEDEATRAMLTASGIRFRELAKLVTGRRFSAGLFHWDVCGVSRSHLARVPPRDLIGLGRALVKLRRFAPLMYPHVNPRRLSAHLEEPWISRSLAVMAETLDRCGELRGFSAASWLWSPETHRVSPRLAAITEPILAGGGFVTTAGPARPDCGVFDRSRRRTQLYQAGLFTPTIGLVLWPREDMLRWWRRQPPTT
jgi:hypothetical protein